MKEVNKEALQNFLKMDLAELSEETPFSEGDGVIEFREEAVALAAALKKTGANLRKVQDVRRRALFLMRGFYFLGVFRGGEAARSTLLGNDEAENGALDLSDNCAGLFMDELKALDSITLESICQGLGL